MKHKNQCFLFLFLFFMIWLDILNMPLCSCAFHLQPWQGTWNRPSPLTRPCKRVKTMKSATIWVCRRKQAEADALTVQGGWQRINSLCGGMSMFPLVGYFAFPSHGSGRDCELAVADCWHRVSLNCASLWHGYIFSSPIVEAQVSPNVYLAIWIKTTNWPWWWVFWKLMPSLSGVKWSMNLGKRTARVIFNDIRSRCSHQKALPQ